MVQRPDYVSLEPKSREELLSQLGSFTPTERALFHKLCDAWEPKIDVKRFRSANGLDLDRNVADLDRLVAKLKRVHLGLYVTRVEGNRRVPSHIVMTAPGDLSFYATQLEEACDSLARGTGSGLPGVERLQSRGIVVPEQHLTTADSTMLASAAGSEEPQMAILRMKLLDDYTVIIPTTRVRQIVSHTLRWIRHAVDDPAFLDEIGRLTGQNTTELRRSLGDKSMAFWHSMCKTIAKQRKALAYRRDVRGDDEVFQAAFLVMSYIDAQSGAAKTREEQLTKVVEALESVESAVREADGGIMDGRRFGEIVAEYERELGSLSGEFHSRLETLLLKPASRRALPVVQYLLGDYMHRDHAYLVFKRLRATVTERLKAEYPEVMEELLRGHRPENAQFFESREAFEADIRRRAEVHEPLVVEFLERPQMLAEAVIHHKKFRQKNLTPQDLRAALSELFDVESSQLVELPILFGLSLIEIFNAAFSRLSVLRQLWLRLNGRYESLHESYSKRTAVPKKRTEHPPQGSRSEDPGATGNPQDASATAERSEGGSVSGARRRGKAHTTPAKPRRKSRAQVDKAWNEFGQAIRKK